MNLVTFQYPGSKKILQAFNLDGETWCMFLQLCPLVGVISYNQEKVLATLKEYQYKTLYNGGMKVHFLNPSGVYQLIDTSPIVDKERLGELREWVSQVVLRSMRVPDFQTGDRTGMREIPFTFNPRKTLLLALIILFPLVGEAQVFSRVSSTNPWMWKVDSSTIYGKVREIKGQLVKTTPIPSPYSLKAYRIPLGGGEYYTLLFTYSNNHLEAITSQSNKAFGEVMRNQFTKVYHQTSPGKWVDLKGKAVITQQEDPQGNTVFTFIPN